MKSRTKKITAFLIPAVLLLCLCAWRLDQGYPADLTAIGLDPSLGRPVLETDSREGLYHRGVLKNLVNFKEDMEPSILADGRWQLTPMGEDLSKLLDRVPEIEKFMPKEGRGYYILVNLNGGDLEAMVEADRLHFIFAFYDPAAQRLYYSEANL